MDILREGTPSSREEIKAIELLPVWQMGETLREAITPRFRNYIEIDAHSR